MYYESFSSISSMIRTIRNKTVQISVKEIVLYDVVNYGR